MKNIVTSAATWLVSGATLPGGSASPTTSASTKVKAGGSGVFKGDIQFTLAGLTDTTGCVQTAPVSATVSPSATKVKAEGSAVVLEGDESDSVTINGMRPGSPPQACSFSVTVKAQAAGQTKVKGN